MTHILLFGEDTTVMHFFFSEYSDRRLPLLLTHVPTGAVISTQLIKISLHSVQHQQSV